MERTGPLSAFGITPPRRAKLAIQRGAGSYASKQGIPHLLASAPEGLHQGQVPGDASLRRRGKWRQSWQFPISTKEIVFVVVQLRTPRPWQS